MIQTPIRADQLEKELSEMSDAEWWDEIRLWCKDGKLPMVMEWEYQEWKAAQERAPDSST